MSETESWAVTVERNGDPVVTLSNRDLSGRNLVDGDEVVIRRAAEHLLSFIASPAIPRPEEHCCGHQAAGFGDHTADCAASRPPELASSGTSPSMVPAGTQLPDGGVVPPPEPAVPSSQVALRVSPEVEALIQRVVAQPVRVMSEPEIREWARRLAADVADAPEPYTSVEARASGVSEGWQPIATAPKDGTPVVLWDPDASPIHAVVGYYHKPAEEWRDYFDAIEPTHWASLPLTAPAVPDAAPQRGEGEK